MAEGVDQAADAPVEGFGEVDFGGADGDGLTGDRVGSSTLRMMRTAPATADGAVSGSSWSQKSAGPIARWAITMRALLCSRR